MLVYGLVRRLGPRLPFNFGRSIHTSKGSSALFHYEDVVADSRSKYQIYLSKTDDPYLNLSIEHHLLQNTPADSTVLFLYANRPCVVIGRNQNPWLETDLSELTGPAELRIPEPLSADSLSGPPERIELVRRRSGGGTVYHGPGNVNYSVICPREQFTRNSHVEMVARALRTMNPSATVNERHDIVLDTGSYERLAEKDALPSEASPLDLSDATATASMDPTPKKVSGSAFKLTRARALHHGTCLLCSPHLAQISKILSSPARHHLRARGVDSVRSPVANVLPPATDAGLLRGNVKHFYGAVLRAFAEMYPAASLSLPDIRAIVDTASNSASEDIDSDGVGKASEPTVQTLHQSTVSGVLGLELAALPSIQSGMSELRSNGWLFEQTPRFSLSTHASASDHSGSNKGYGIFLAARAGALTGASIIVPRHDLSTAELNSLAEQEANKLDPPAGSLAQSLMGTELWRPQDWDRLIADAKLTRAESSTNQGTVTVKKTIATWLKQMLPLPELLPASEP